MTDMAFSCACGAVTGRIADVGPSQGDYVYCHCSDCQAVPRLLGAEKRILEHAGGTALYQSRCARLMIASGRDMLAGIHLTEKPTLRWCARCCDTPLFNTYRNGRIPYITVLVANCDDTGRRALGKPRGHLYLADATGDVEGLEPMSMAALMRSFFKRLVKDVVSGDHRRNPLFDPDTFEPIVEPRQLTAQERDAIG